MKMTITLFDSIINTSQDCVFWKDKDRRFVGVIVRNHMMNFAHSLIASGTPFSLSIIDLDNFK